MKNLIPGLLCLFLCNVLIAQNIEFELFETGFNDPVNIQHAGDDRLFIVEQGGIIKILNSDGTTNATPFLNVSSLVSNGSEQGLLGLAFHPNYSANGFFYVYYTDTSGDTQISRYSVSAGDPDVADPGSEFPILDFTQNASNHNGGCLAFGSDGFLYIASGDGGGTGDPGDRAQNTTILLGKMLRIDVDNPGGGNNYGIPSSNPFAGSPTNAQEIWAYGLRNPWKFSFDSVTNDLWIGDVGQFDVEEINKAGATEAGLNYGWRCYEGSQPFNTTGCPAIGTLTFPIGEYSSSTGSGNCSVTGGYVYRGSNYPGLQGLYIFADFCSGLIGTIDGAGTLVNHGTTGSGWTTFGVDVNNELYIAGTSGNVFKVIDAALSISEIEALSLTMTPNPATFEVTFISPNTSIESVSIIDIKGSVLFSEENINTFEKTINVEQLSEGIYLVRVMSKAGDSTIKKLVIR